MKIDYYRRQLIKDGRLVFHKGIRPVPKDEDDRESFWINRIKSHNLPDQDKFIARIIRRSAWFHNVTMERIKK